MSGREFRKFHHKQGKYTPYAQSLNPTVQVNKDIKKYVIAASASGATDSWTSKTELPSSSEIMGKDGDDSDEVLLAPNNIHGRWVTKEQYLETHYNLLREDSIAPLRDAVAYVRQMPHLQDTSDYCIYEKVFEPQFALFQSDFPLNFPLLS